MMTKYPYGLATYPHTFKGTVVSPTKICLQFANPECMLRTLGNDATMMPKDPATHQPTLTISTDLLQLEVIAVGCQMPVLLSLLKEVIQGLDKYAYNHQEVYQDTYKTELKDDLKLVQRDLNDLISKYWR